MNVLKMGGGVNTVKYIRVLPLFWKKRMKGLNLRKRIPGLAQISSNFAFDDLSNNATRGCFITSVSFSGQLKIFFF